MSITLTTASIVLLALLLRSIIRSAPTPTELPPGALDARAFGGLRSIFFGTDRMSLPEEVADHPVFGAAMEIGFPPGTATIVALADGTAHLYLETGGGIVGAGRSERVHRAAVAFVESAGDCRDLGEPCEAPPPLPDNREVRFHWLTAEGVRTVAVPELELEVGRHPLHPLHVRGQDLLEQIRHAHTPVPS